MSFRNEFYRESKQKFATVTPNAEPSPWRRAVMLNLIQHLYNPSIYRPQIPGQARNDVYLQMPVIAVLDTAIYPQICKKDCHVFSQRILPREQAKVCDCHPERRTVTLNEELSPWRRTVMLNLIQHLYKLSIYRPQIPGQARNDVYLQKPVIAVSQAHSHVEWKVGNICITITEQIFRVDYKALMFF